MQLSDFFEDAVNRATGAAIRRLRTNNGYTRERLAEEIGAKKGLIERIEDASSKPTIAQLVAISHVFDTTLDALVPVLTDEDLAQ